MKKVFAIVMALVLCFGLLCIGAVAADYQYVTVTGTMNGWNPASEADRMTETGDGLYTITYENMAAGSYEFKFTANGNWSDLDLGGAYLGSGVESSLSWGGSNIKFTLDEASDVTIELDVTNYKFTLTVGGQVEESKDITIHISVPEDWGTAYAYCWNPESLGSWPGTAVTDGAVTLPAVFDGFIINNNNGRQTADIKDIDLTKEEVWVTVHADNTYTLSYEAPSGNEPEPEVSYIKIHVIAPESWENVYAYAYNPEQCGTWPGTAVTEGFVEVIASFEGFIVNNGAGAQTGDIKDIDLTAEEVWVVVAEDCSYALYYSEADVVLPEPPATIKINVIAAHWESVYAYTYNPASCGNWPGKLVENGVVEVPANFEGLVLNNGVDQQTADIKDIDLTKEEVWITVNEDNTYTLSYEAPVVEDPGTNPEGPTTGDALLSCCVVLMMSAVGLVTVASKKRG